MSTTKVKNSNRALPQYPTKLTTPVFTAYASMTFLLAATIRAMYNCKDNIKAMSTYGAYHRNPTNQVIHFFGIPLLIFTIFIFGAHLPLTSSLTLKLAGAPKHHPNLSTVMLLSYLVFYFKIDKYGFLFITPLMYFMYITAVKWTATDQLQALDQTEKTHIWGTGRLLKWTLVLHIIAWYLQIHLGHAISEGGKPALLDGLGEAFSSAPLFALYEGIWAIGLRKDFHTEIQRHVSLYTAELCAAGSKMRVCSMLE